MKKALAVTCRSKSYVYKDLHYRIPSRVKQREFYFLIEETNKNFDIRRKRKILRRMVPLQFEICLPISLQKFGVAEISQTQGGTLFIASR